MLCPRDPHQARHRLGLAVGEGRAEREPWEGVLWGRGTGVEVSDRWGPLLPAEVPPGPALKTPAHPAS